MKNKLLPESLNLSVDSAALDHRYFIIEINFEILTER